MPDSTPPTGLRRANVYIDAWNLYYGCLKKSPYKWLNVAEMVVRSMPPTYQINHIRFFTARARSRPSNPHGPARQELLFRALQTIPNLTMHYGTFLMSTPMMRLVTPLPDGTAYLPVVKTEEKGSDVNLATYLLVDGFNGEYEAAIVVSDDSDLAEPIKVVRQQLRLHVTVLSPRGKSRELSLVATRFRQIQKAVLAASQFPHVLSDANGTFTKPSIW